MDMPKLGGNGPSSYILNWKAKIRNYLAHFEIETDGNVKSHNVSKGFKIRKLFEDGNYYEGQVVSGPSMAFDEEIGSMVLCWKVKYLDDDEEEFTLEELNQWGIDDNQVGKVRHSDVMAPEPEVVKSVAVLNDEQQAFGEAESVARTISTGNASTKTNDASTRNNTTDKQSKNVESDQTESQAKAASTGNDSADLASIETSLEKNSAENKSICITAAGGCINDKSSAEVALTNTSSTNSIPTGNGSSGKKSPCTGSTTMIPRNKRISSSATVPTNINTNETGSTAFNFFHNGSRRVAYTDVASEQDQSIGKKVHNLRFGNSDNSPLTMEPTKPDENDIHKVPGKSRKKHWGTRKALTNNLIPTAASVMPMENEESGRRKSARLSATKKEGTPVKTDDIPPNQKKDASVSSLSIRDLDGTPRDSNTKSRRITRGRIVEKDQKEYDNEKSKHNGPPREGRHRSNRRSL